MAWFNLQSTRRFCYYYDPPFVLLDGLERSQWKRGCLHVRHNRTTRGVLVWLTRKVARLSSLVVFCCSLRVFSSSSSEIHSPVSYLVLLVSILTPRDALPSLVHVADTSQRRILVCICSYNDPLFQCSRSVPTNWIHIWSKLYDHAAHPYIAPYSSSTTDTAAGLASEGFMNTYGKFNQWFSNFDQRL